MRGITALVIHCSATKNGDGAVTLETIDTWHRARGWQGCGYHVVIEVDGEVRIGRPLEQPGAHVAGSNAHSIGVCMIGSDRFAARQWGALHGVVATLTHRFQGARVLGHRDYSPDLDGDGKIEPWEYFKLCPGFSVAQWRAGGMQPLLPHVLAP